MSDFKENKKNYNAYVKFSTMVIQMGAIIGLSTWFGVWLDKKSANKTPVWTIVFSLLGTAMALYLIIRDVMNQNKKDEK